jgi:hypothetical protein
MATTILFPKLVFAKAFNDLKMAVEDLVKLRPTEEFHSWKVDIGRGCLILATIFQCRYRGLSHPIHYFRNLYKGVLPDRLFAMAGSKDSSVERVSSITPSGQHRRILRTVQFPEVARCFFQMDAYACLLREHRRFRSLHHS